MSQQLAPHQQRVVDEKRDLDEKLKKLTAFISSESFATIVQDADERGRFTTAYRDTKIGVRVSCGCFTGTAQEFSAQIEATHAGNQQHLQQYRLFCQLIAFSFDIQPA